MFSSVLETIGGTPLVQLRRFSPQSTHPLLAKIEAGNPGGSIKDRPALAIILEAERLGLLTPGGVIVEATSGNFGVALAMIGAARGYRVVIVTDPKLPSAYRRLMLAYGAELIDVTVADESGGYFKPRLAMANRLAAELPDAFRPNQHFSLMNAAAHYASTGPELLRQTAGGLDFLVVAISTAGQIRGLSEYFARRCPSTRVVGVDAVGSGIFGTPPAPYLQTGIGLSWPPSNLDLDLIDLLYQVSDADAFGSCRQLALTEGLLTGASSGAVAFAALQLAQAHPQARIGCVMSDSGQRYLDTVYCDEWLAEQGLKLAESLDQLHVDARTLVPLPREAVREQIRTVPPHQPPAPPESTEVLNEAARRLMPAGHETRQVDGVGGYSYRWNGHTEIGVDTLVKEMAALVATVSQGEPFIGMPSKIDETQSGALTDRLAAALQSERTHVLEARHGAQLVGCVLLTRSATVNQAHIAELTTAAVHPDHRGFGHVSSALTEVVLLCERIGVGLIKLDVREGIQAERLWRSYGFTEYGRLNDYGRIDGQSYSGIFMAQPVDKLKKRLAKKG